jgi:hypothetical protein
MFTPQGTVTDLLEGYKEDSSKGPMLRFEESLPKLPVPTLEETATRYLKSVHPLLSSSEFESTTKAVQEFIKQTSGKADRPTRGSQAQELDLRMVE